MAEQHAHSKLVRAELVQQQNGRYQDLYQRQAVNTPWYATDEAEPCGKRLVERVDLFLRTWHARSLQHGGGAIR